MNRFTALLEHLAQEAHGDPEALAALEEEIGQAYDLAKATVSQFPADAAQLDSFLSRFHSDYTYWNEIRMTEAQRAAKEFEGWLRTSDVTDAQLEVLLRNLLIPVEGARRAVTPLLISVLPIYVEHRQPPKWFWDWWHKEWRVLSSQTGREHGKWELLKIFLARPEATHEQFLQYVSQLRSLYRPLPADIYIHRLASDKFVMAAIRDKRIGRETEYAANCISDFYTVDPARLLRLTDEPLLAWCLDHDMGWGADLFDYLSQALSLVPQEAIVHAFTTITPPSPRLWPMLKAAFARLDRKAQAKVLATCPNFAPELWSGINRSPVVPSSPRAVL